jgi:hypothetical protein
MKQNIGVNVTNSGKPEYYKYIKNLYYTLSGLPKFLAKSYLVVMYFLFFKSDKKYTYSFLYNLFK